MYCNEKKFKKLCSFLLSFVLVMAFLTPSVMASTQEMNDLDNRKIEDSLGVGIPAELAEYNPEDFDITDFINFSGFDDEAITVPIETFGTDVLDIASVELGHEIPGEYEISMFSSYLFPDVSAPVASDILSRNNMQSAQSVTSDSLISNDIAHIGANNTMYNTDPNSAIYIPDTLFGLTLQDLANDEQRWYLFDVPANEKVTSFLNYQSGIYALGLYELNGVNLELVASSLFGGGSERLHYISQSGGIFFLAVLPIIPTSTPHLFNFVIEQTASFDSYEVNSFYDQAPVFTNSINIYANLDSIYDEDWFQLNITQAGTREIALFNAPTGQHYAVFLYDSNLNSVGSFYADHIPRSVSMSQGTYYVRILTLSGQRTDNNYWLNVTNAFNSMVVFNGNVYFIEPTQRYEIYNNQFYILESDEGFYVHEGNVFIISLNSNGVNINRTPVNIFNRQHFFGQSGQYVFFSSLNPSAYGTALQEVSIYGQTRVVLEFDIIGFFAEPAGFSPTGYWYYDTYPSGVYPNYSTPVRKITVWLCVYTQNVFHARWYP
jgi:hypothetical protein